jgi:hypothetical protein
MKTLPSVLAVAILAALGCSSPSMPAAPGAPSPPAPTPSPAPTGTLAGAWTGTGTDPQGAEKMSWMLTQNGSALSGSADLAPLNAADGSCASCHKFKSGTITGSVSGSALAVKLTFPSGGDGVPTPMCTISFDASATVDGGRISATYTGDDSCEGPFTGGTFVMSR